MTSREEIALKLTLENTSNIFNNIPLKTDGTDNDVLVKEVTKFYNYIYANINTNDNTPIKV